jgi:N-acetyl-anhydromuramoyl-L-alanine amidase
MPKRCVWRNGWWSACQHRISPNHGPRPEGARVSLAVVHAISLPPGVYQGCGVERLFTNQLDWDSHPYFQSIRGLQVSAHFFIRRSGRTLQFVSVEQRAWHAGVSSWRGRDNCNDWSIGIELEGLEGDGFASAQYRSLATLLSALTRQYPLLEAVGHEHIAPGRKADPGAGFDWADLRRRLRPPRLFLPAASQQRANSEPDSTRPGSAFALRRPV